MRRPRTTTSTPSPLGIDTDHHAINYPNNHQSYPHREHRRSRGRIGINQFLVCLAILNIGILVVVFPAHQEVLSILAAGTHHSTSDGHPSYVNDIQQNHQQSKRRQQQNWSRLQQHSWQQENLATIDHVDQLPIRRIPSISPQKWIDKYGGSFSSKSSSSPPTSLLYNGRLPSKYLHSDSPTFEPPSYCGAQPDYTEFFKLSMAQRSRFHEDHFLYNLFFKPKLSSREDDGPATANTDITGKYTERVNKRREGTNHIYIELGAFDGKQESNSIFFDECLGWDGLLIEAQPLSYQKVLVNRPNAIALSFSPTCPDEDSGATANQQKVVTFYDYPLSNNGMEGLALSYQGKNNTILVPCGSLTSVILDTFGPSAAAAEASSNFTTISFLSLDVEGAEKLVLSTIDFPKIDIRVLLVEIKNTHCPTVDQCLESIYSIRKHMATSNLYALFTDTVENSDVYVRIGSEEYNRIIEFQREKRWKLFELSRQFSLIHKNDTHQTAVNQL